MADIPAGTGLGSSGSFTTALLKALHTYKKNLIHPRELAEQACHIEIDRLGEPIGKQDQYIAAFGGITCFQFLPNGQVEAWPLQASTPRRSTTSRTTCCCSSPATAARPRASSRSRTTRASSATRAWSTTCTSSRSSATRARRRSRPATCARFAELMNVHWEHKKQRSGAMSNGEIDHWYDLATRQRRARRQADRRRRRRLPDVLRRGQDAAAARHAPNAACARCASASTSKAPRWCCSNGIRSVASRRLSASAGINLAAAHPCTL